MPVLAPAQHAAQLVAEAVRRAQFAVAEAAAELAAGGLAQRGGAAAGAKKAIEGVVVPRRRSRSFPRATRGKAAGRGSHSPSPSPVWKQRRRVERDHADAVEGNRSGATGAPRRSRTRALRCCGGRGRLWPCGGARGKRRSPTRVSHLILEVRYGKPQHPGIGSRRPCGDPAPPPRPATRSPRFRSRAGCPSPRGFREPQETAC